MKNLFVFLFLCNFLLLCHAHGGGNYEHSDMLASMKPGDKAVLLMVHFGTTHDDTRALTIDAINAKTQAAFPELKFQEAYTSRIIIRRLKERGITKLTPLDAMLKLRSEGYTHLIVQSTNIIDGVEMESLRRDVESALPFFKEIRVGTPLLYSIEDAEKVASILGNRYNAPAQSKKATKEHFVLVGHGTYTPSTRNDNADRPAADKQPGIDAYSHYYAILDLTTGTKTRLSYDGKEIGYSGGRFSQRSVIFNNKAYIGVNTEEDANAVIYIYDIKTGNVEKGAEVDGRFYFDMIRVIEND